MWSLGVMLHELLAGARPFPGENRDPTLPARVVNDPPSLLTESPKLAPGTDDRLERIVLTALAKEPARRYPSAAALAADLDLWLTDAAMDTRPLADARRHAARAEPVAVVPAPLRRRRSGRWVAVGLVAGVAILSAVALARPWRKEAAKPTLLEEFAATGEVVVVDAEGNRRFELTTLPGSQGSLQHDAEGFLLATGAPAAQFEISAVAPPMPYRLRAKVYHQYGEILPFVGIYVRRAAHAARAGPLEEHNAFALGLDTVHTGNAREGRIVPAGTRFDPNRILTNNDLMTSEHEVRVSARHRIAPKDFFELVLDVRPEGVACAAEGQPFEPLAWPLAEVGNRLMRRDEGLPVPDRLLGDGFGLIVGGGAAGYRDVILSRIP